MSRLLVAVAALMLVACQEPAAPADGGDCTSRTTVAVGTPVTGALAAGDCTIDGMRVDKYTLQLTAQSMLSLNAGSVQFGIEKDVGPGAEQEVFSDVKGAQIAALPPGTYTIHVYDSGNASYTLSVVPATMPTGCNIPVFITRGTTVSGAINQSSCSANSYYNRLFVFLGVANEAYAFSTTASMGTNLEVNRNGSMLANHPNNTAGANSLSYRPSVREYYNIGVIGIPQNTFGTYTLTMQ